MSCSDCPRGCASRGPDSFCGVDRPGRWHWKGVTMLEEHELAPTYEIWFTGCSLRCRFCTVPDAVTKPRLGSWLPPEELVEHILEPRVPPFRAISLVGGDPAVNRPYVDALLPLLRRRLPDSLLVLNTNLFTDPSLAARDADRFDWVIGDVHFWRPGCARQVAGAAAYPELAVAAAEAIVAAGGRLMLRILVLPGHLRCCAEPTISWASSLAMRADGRMRVHILTNYAPAGAARTDPVLGRALRPEERALAHGMLPDACPQPSRQALSGTRPRPVDAHDPPAPIEIGPDGTLLLPFVTGSLLPLAVEFDPSLRDRLRYLEG
ncbi:MAG: radical SAM protein [Oligoflexia bacterium]|nr:radical SAM protein [Oligoflexia bacterium]